MQPILLAIFDVCVRSVLFFVPLPPAGSEQAEAKIADSISAVLPLACMTCIAHFSRHHGGVHTIGGADRCRLLSLCRANIGGTSSCCMKHVLCPSVARGACGAMGVSAVGVTCNVLLRNCIQCSAGGGGSWRAWSVALHRLNQKSICGVCTHLFVSPLSERGSSGDKTRRGLLSSQIVSEKMPCGLANPPCSLSTCLLCVVYFDVLSIRHRFWLRNGDKAK